MITSKDIASLSIWLNLPPKALSPNARCHWAVKAGAVKAYRHAACVMAIAAIAGRTPPRWEKAAAKATFYFKLRRTRDEDNLQASLKAAFDGIAQAGVVANDSGLTHEPPEVRQGEPEDRVEIVITPT